MNKQFNLVKPLNEKKKVPYAKIIFSVLFLGMFLLMLLSAVFSAPPFQTSGTTTPALTITYPKVMYYPEETNVTLHFHVYNSTSYIVTSATTSCVLHLYSSQNGSHLIEALMSFDSNELEFYYKVPSTEFENRNEYPYLVQCNNSAEAGFISGEFNINGNGEEPTTTSILFYALPILFVIFVLVIELIATINAESFPMKLGMAFASYVTSIIITFALYVFTDGFFMSLLYLVSVFKFFFYLQMIMLVPITIITIGLTIMYALHTALIKELLLKSYPDSDIKRIAVDKEGLFFFNMFERRNIK